MPVPYFISYCIYQHVNSVRAETVVSSSAGPSSAFRLTDHTELNSYLSSAKVKDKQILVHQFFILMALKNLERLCDRFRHRHQS